MAKANGKGSTERVDPLASLRDAGLEQKKVVEASTTTTSPAGGGTQIPSDSGSNGLQEKATGRVLKPDEEKATEQVTAYFTTAQYDKIEELQRAYRKKAKKRITVNALLRRLVEHATVEDIL